VVAATGTGYQGVHTDEKTKASVAKWKLPRSAPKDQEKLSITLSKPVTAAANLSGDIRWTKPSSKSGPSTDVVNIAPAPPRCGSPSAACHTGNRGLVAPVIEYDGNF
jgi:hypothetical protein